MLCNISEMEAKNWNIKKTFTCVGCRQQNCREANMSRSTISYAPKICLGLVAGADQDLFLPSPDQNLLRLSQLSVNAI